MEVEDWLRLVELDEYAPQFRDNHVTWDLLATLTADDLRDLGVASVGHRRRLLDAISRLRDGSKADLPASEAQSANSGETRPGERRLVTVLFADLTGYTRLSKLLDAEEIERVLSAFFELADAIIVEHGGTIDKHIGDCVMAVFGAPVAHGNDAERAVLAALSIRDAIPLLRERLGRDIGVHVGVASGEVLASEVGSARHKAYTVTGDIVNLASRLTDQARSGEVLLSSAVHRLLHDRLDCEDVGYIEVKGFAVPERVWRLLGKRAMAAGARAFVGRHDELRHFATAMTNCLQSAQGSIIHVRGEAGLGKTRLVEEFQDRARQNGFRCHSGLVLDFGRESGRDAVRTIIRSIVQETHGGRAEPVDPDRMVLANQITSEQAIFIHDLLNVPLPAELRPLYDAMDTGTRNRGTMDTITALVAGVARANPLLIVVEDLHWADPAVLAQVGALADATSDSPLLLVLTSRNVGIPAAGGWQLYQPILTMDLAPLRPEEALALARNVHGQIGSAVMSCLERAAGNPLFLEQLLRHAEEQSDGAVPDSIQSLVQARIDRLDPAEKHALQAASVFGQRVSLGGLRALIQNPNYAPIVLIGQNLLRPLSDEFLFGHALIRDAVYATLLRSRRRELHRRAASWFAGHDLDLHAEHLGRAEDPAAPQAYLMAARSSAAQYRYEQALSLIERGAVLAGDRHDRFALACYRGELLHDTGAVIDARAAYTEALRQSQDDAERCRAWLGLAAVKRVTDDLAGALADIERAEDTAARLSLPVEAARAHFLHGNLLFPQGDVEGCLREHRLCLDLARKAGSAELEAAAFGGLGDAEYARGRMLSASRNFANCIELSRRHGYGRTEVANLPMSSFMRYFAGETREALAEALDCIEMATRVGHRRALTVAHHAAYRARLSLGEFEAARTNVEAALELARQLKARRFEAEALAFGAELNRLTGRMSEAISAIQEALVISAETEMAYFGPVYYGILAMIEQEEGRRRMALSDGEALLSGNVMAHNHLLFRKDAIEATMLLRDWNEVERHTAALEDFVRPEPIPWTDFIIARARTFAALGSGRGSAKVENELLWLQTAGERLGIYMPGFSEMISPASG